MTIGSGRSLSFEVDGAPLGRWGVLVPVGVGHAGIRNPDGGFRMLDMLPPEMVGLLGWIDDVSGLLVLGAEQADTVIVLDLNSDEVVTGIDLDRDPDVGLRSMVFFAVDDQSIACLCETSIFAIGAEGQLRWYRTHDDLTMGLVGVNGGVIRLESTMPDLNETTYLSLDAETGIETAGV